MYASMIGTLGVTAAEVDVPNISDRYINASLCEFLSVTSGIECDGFCSFVEYTDDIFGMLDLLGGNSAVSDICYALVLGIYALCHL